MSALEAILTGALFAIDPMSLGPGKDATTYQTHAATLARYVHNDHDLRAYLTGWGWESAYDTLSHLIGT